MKRALIGLLLAIVGLLPEELSAIAIREFSLGQGRGPYCAEIVWGDGISPADAASREIYDDPPFVRVGGVAFIDVFKRDGLLEVRTAWTDTNGDYSREAIDWIDLIVDCAGVFPSHLTGLRFSSRFSAPGYVISALPDTLFGFRIETYTEQLPPEQVPDTVHTITALTAVLSGLLFIARSRRTPDRLAPMHASRLR